VREPVAWLCRQLIEAEVSAQIGAEHGEVSRLCRGLDEQVRIFRERPLEGAYPYVWLDGKTERVRERGGVIATASVRGAAPVTGNHRLAPTNRCGRRSIGGRPRQRAHRQSPTIA
jgi:hypothetical protein